MIMLGSLNSESPAGGAQTRVTLGCLALVALVLVTLETSVGNPAVHLVQIVPILLAGAVIIARPAIGSNLAMGVMGFWFLLFAAVTLALTNTDAFTFTPFTLSMYLATIVFSAVGIVAAFRDGRQSPLLARVVLVLGGLGLQTAFTLARFTVFT